MTQAHASAAQPAPPFIEQLLHNGVVERVVKVTAGDYKGRKLTFTRVCPDQYTVYGLSRLLYDGIVIDRRQPWQSDVRLYSSWARYILQPEHEWIAHSFVHECYHGVLGVGATPEEAYRNTFNRFRKSWPA